MQVRGNSRLSRPSIAPRDYPPCLEFLICKREPALTSPLQKLLERGLFTGVGVWFSRRQMVRFGRNQPPIQDDPSELFSKYLPLKRVRVNSY